MRTIIAVIVDVSIVAGLALLVCTALRRRPAALRHTILAAALAAVAAAPAFEIALPHWELPVLSSAAPVADPVPVLTSDLTTTSTVAVSAVPAVPRRSWVPVLVTLWAAGFLVVMVGLLTGLVRLVRLTRACRPVCASSAWKERAEALSAQSALARPVVVLESHERAALLTWGVLRPRIVVPAHARSWARDRIEIVLAHELAHIVRRDWVLQIGAEVLRAVYWFNPLIWMVCRRLRYEAEQACDDAVLRTGVDAADYAAHLLAVARDVQATGRAWASAPAIASPSTLERRIAVILNGQRNHTPPGRATRIVMSLAIVAAMVPVTAATLTDRVDIDALASGAAGDIELSAAPREQEPSAAPVTQLPLEPVRGKRNRVAEPVALAQAQAAPLSGTSTLAGSIRDTTGALMPGVMVSLTNRTTSERVETVTDASGQFRFRGLPASQYDLLLQLRGFATTRDVITLTAGQDLQTSLTMRVGQLSETLIITCAPAAAADPSSDAGVMAYRRASAAPRLFTMPRRIPGVTPLPAAQQMPVRVGGNIRAPQRVKSVTPVCPGTPPADGLAVILEGTIGADGRVSDVVLLRPGVADAAGLARAALDAFRQWEYTPTLLNNVPTPVIVTATMVFNRP